MRSLLSLFALAVLLAACMPEPVYILVTPIQLPTQLPTSTQPPTATPFPTAITQTGREYYTGLMFHLGYDLYGSAPMSSNLNLDIWRDDTGIIEVGLGFDPDTQEINVVVFKIDTTHGVDPMVDKLIILAQAFDYHDQVLWGLQQGKAGLSQANDTVGGLSVSWNFDPASELGAIMIFP